MLGIHASSLGDSISGPRKPVTVSPVIVYLAIFACAAAPALRQWRLLDTCHGPLNYWVLGALLLLAAFRALLALGAAASLGTASWFVRPRGSGAARGAFAATWAVLLPALGLWTALGCRWLTQSLLHTPECLGEGVPTLLAACQVLSGAWVIGYAVFVAIVWDTSRALASSEAAIRAVEDEELRRRWGSLQPSAEDVGSATGGLPPELLANLPKHMASCCPGAAPGEVECSVCLDAIGPGETVRELPGCGHVFHRPCIDLWLLRNARCPLCKVEVATGPVASSTPARRCQRLGAALL